MGYKIGEDIADNVFLQKALLPIEQEAKLVVKYLPRRYNNIDELRTEIEEYFGDNLLCKNDLLSISFLCDVELKWRINVEETTT